MGEDNARQGVASPQYGLEMNLLRHELAVVGGIAEGKFSVLGTLEVQVHVVFPGEADATVYLNAFARRVTVGITAVGLGHGHRTRAGHRCGSASR